MHNIFIQMAVGYIYSGQLSDAYMRQQLLTSFKSGDRSKDYIRNDPCHFEV